MRAIGAKCTREKCEVGNRLIVYFKIRFPRENTWNNKLLISQLNSSFFRNFEFECFQFVDTKIDQYVCFATIRKVEKTEAMISVLSNLLVAGLSHENRILKYTI